MEGMADVNAPGEGLSHFVATLFKDSWRGWEICSLRVQRIELGGACDSMGQPHEGPTPFH